MKTKLILTLMIALLLPIISHAQEISKPLKLTIEADKANYNVWDKIEIKATVENISNQEICYLESSANNFNFLNIQNQPLLKDNRGFDDIGPSFSAGHGTFCTNLEPKKNLTYYLTLKIIPDRIILVWDPSFYGKLKFATKKLLHKINSDREQAPQKEVILQGPYVYYRNNNWDNYFFLNKNNQILIKWTVQYKNNNDSKEGLKQAITSEPIGINIQMK